MNTIKNKVFNIKMTTQDRVTYLFNELDRLLYKALFIILDVSPLFIGNFLIDLSADVISGVSKNRNIYYKDCYVLNAYSNFGNKIFYLSYLLSCKNINSKELLRSIKRIKFIRKIIENCIENLVYYSDDYLAYTNKLTNIINEFNSINNKEDSIKIWSRYSKISLQMMEIENIVGISRSQLYNVLLEVNDIMIKVALVKKKIILPYLRVCYSVANKISKDPTKLNSNYQNSIYGLMYALDCFNQHRKKSFGSYVKLWARQTILYNIKKNNYIKLPLNVWQTHASIDKAITSLMHKYGRSDISPDIIAKETKLDEAQIKSVLHQVKMTQVYSLDHIITTNDDTKSGTLLDTIADKSYDEKDDNRTFALREKVIGLQDSEEKKILCLHIGLLDILQKKSIPKNQKKKEILRQSFYKKLYL